MLAPPMFEGKPELLLKYSLSMKGGFNWKQRGCKGGKQRLLKLPIVPVMISWVVQMGIMLVLFHESFHFFGFFFSNRKIKKVYI
jgi:hypothetical protein